MIKSKIDPSQVQLLAWKDYVKLLEKDIRQAKSKGLDRVPLVMVANFEFACGETHALLLLGKQSVMTKFYKGLKTDGTRKKLKDYSIGFCYFDKEEDGSSSIRLAIEGFGKPTQMKKNSKKLAKKLGLNIKEIIKGQYTDEIAQTIEQEELTDVELTQQNSLNKQAFVAQQEATAANDHQSLQEVYKTFVLANKKMTTIIIPLLKDTDNSSIYTTNHVQITEKAFRTAASLVDKYEELNKEEHKLIKTAPKITALKAAIVEKDLVRKYSSIWKKVQRMYDEQLEELDMPLKKKFAQVDTLMKRLKQLIANQS
jgi:tRNA isopentenyl-2-thiomethyl-A-37 hydroxylase MiaE